MEKITIRPSSLAGFTTEPFKGIWYNYSFLQTDTVNNPAYYGTVVHKMMEGVQKKYTKAEIRNRFTIIPNFSKKNDRNTTAYKKIKKAQTKPKLLLTNDEFEYLYDNYVQLKHYVNKTFTGGVFEYEVKNKISTNEYNLEGITDLVIKSGDKLDIIDYKTTSMPYNCRKYMNTSYFNQLYAYAKLISHKYNIKPENVKCNILVLVLSNHLNKNIVHLKKQYGHMEEVILSNAIKGLYKKLKVIKEVKDKPLPIVDVINL